MRIPLLVATMFIVLSGSLCADEKDAADGKASVPDAIVFFRKNNTAIRDEVTNRIVGRSSDIRSAMAIVSKHEDGKQVLIAWSVEPLKMGWVPEDSVCAAEEAEPYFAGRILGNPSDFSTTRRQAALKMFLDARGKKTTNAISVLCVKLANALEAIDRKPEALEWAERAVITGERDPATHFARAQVEYDLLMHDEAIRDYQEAVRLNPRYHQSWTGIGNIQLYREKFPEAVEAYSRSLSREPDALVFYNRCRAYSGLSKIDEAMADANSAIRLNSRSAEAFYMRAQLYRTQNKLEEAIRDFDQTLKLKPALVSTFVERGSTYYGMQRYDKAEEDYSKAINARVNNKSLRGWLCLVRLKQKKWEVALQDAEICLKATPTAWIPHQYAAQACEGLGNFAKAIEYYEAAVKLRPDDYTVLNAVAWTMCTSPHPELRNGARAVELATRGCEVSKWEEMNVLDTLAAANAEAGSFEEAIRCQKMAIEKSDEQSRAGMEARLKLFEMKQTYTEYPPGEVPDTSSAEKEADGEAEISKKERSEADTNSETGKE